jgi:hypothetical protein
VYPLPASATLIAIVSSSLLSAAPVLSKPSNKTGCAAMYWAASVRKSAMMLEDENELVIEDL